MKLGSLLVLSLRLVVVDCQVDTAGPPFRQKLIDLSKASE